MFSSSESRLILIFLNSDLNLGASFGFESVPFVINESPSPLSLILSASSQKPPNSND
jgi:hypothetical protein